MAGFTWAVVPVSIPSMTQPITLPLWAFVLILLFAAVTFASHFLFPSVRWFFRKRAERLVAQLNTRLQRPIEPFKLAKRYDMIQRLLYDPAITKAIYDHAQDNDVPENVAFETARRSLWGCVWRAGFRGSYIVCGLARLTVTRCKALIKTQPSSL